MIPELKVVKFTGFDSSLPTIGPITSLNDQVAGIMSEELADQANGNMVGLNFIFGIDTSSFIAGADLYSDANGDLTTTITALKVGIVIVSDAVNGVIFADPIKAVPDSGSVTSHGDVSNAGSGIIISALERAALITNTSDIIELFSTRDIEAQIITRQYEVGEIFRHTDGKNYRTNTVSPAGQTPTTNPANFSLINTDSDTFIASASSGGGTSNQYLKSNELFTNVTPIVLPFDATLIAMSAATNGIATWAAEIHIGLVLVVGAALSIVATDSAITTMSVDFNAGDKIQMFNNGNSDNPSFYAVFRRR